VIARCKAIRLIAMLLICFASARGTHAQEASSETAINSTESKTIYSTIEMSYPRGLREMAELVATFETVLGKRRQVLIHVDSDFRRFEESQAVYASKKTVANEIRSALKKDEFETTKQFENRTLSERRKLEKLEEEMIELGKLIAPDLEDTFKKKLQEVQVPIRLVISPRDARYDADNRTMECTFRFDENYRKHHRDPSGGINLEVKLRVSESVAKKGFSGLDRGRLTMNIDGVEEAKTIKKALLEFPGTAILGQATVVRGDSPYEGEEFWAKLGKDRGLYSYSITLTEVENIEIANVGDLNSLGIKWQLGNYQQTLP